MRLTRIKDSDNSTNPLSD